MVSLHRLSHHLLHRMPYSLVEAPEGEWLVMGASPRAGLLGCGGAILRRGVAGKVWVWADGQTDHRGEPELADGFGFATVTSGDAIGMLFREGRVRAVFAPFFGSVSPDDRRVLSALVDQLRATRGWDGEVWCYERNVPLWPNRGVDITEVAGRKYELLRAGDSARSTQIADGLSRYRGLRPVVANAEAFLVLERKAFLREARRWKV